MARLPGQQRILVMPQAAVQDQPLVFGGGAGEVHRSSAGTSTISISESSPGTHCAVSLGVHRVVGEAADREAPENLGQIAADDRRSRSPAPGTIVSQPSRSQALIVDQVLAFVDGFLRASRNDELR